MKKQNSNLKNAAKLRQKAEEKLKLQKSQADKAFSEADMLKLIQELEVHQIELELQNEELVTAKDKAELSEEKYTELYDFAPSGYLSINKEGEIYELNFAAARLLGKERSGLIKNRITSFISPETLSGFNLFVQKVFTNKTKQSCESTITTKGSVPLYVNFEGLVSRNNDLCLLTVVDITERKKAEQEIIASKEEAEHSEEKFRTLFNKVTDAIFFYDPETFKIIEANEATSKLYGYGMDELIGMSCIKFSAEVDKSNLAATNVLNKGSEYVYLRHHKKKDGTDLFLQLQLHKLVVKSETISVAICHDITDTIKSEQDLIAAKEKAEESDRLKTAFLANMSHEIRTPMNGILGFADLLKTPGLAGDEQKKFIEIIERSGARMLNIINQIIDISKIEAGLVKPNLTTTSIDEQIEYVYTFFKPEAKARKINFAFKTPFSEKESIINTDNEKMYAILINLVKNALKYTEKGSIELGYNLKTDSEPGEVEVYVKDTGIGIPENRQKAIFERFIQADITDKKARQGAGLGLAICKAYVEMLGGKIWVESEEGQGSTFYFTLPYNTKHTEEVYNSQNSISEKNVISRKLKILIVEDDEVSELLIDTYINSFGKEILIARTGIEAIKACRDNTDIDLILMDIRMPKMNGHDAARQIRKFNKEVIIIAQTAYGLSGDREKSLESGCNDYIAKPIMKNDLQLLIQKYFG